jgi:hypothetical protein
MLASIPREGLWLPLLAAAPQQQQQLSTRGQPPGAALDAGERAPAAAVRVVEVRAPLQLVVESREGLQAVVAGGGGAQPPSEGTCRGCTRRTETREPAETYGEFDERDRDVSFAYRITYHIITFH